MGDSARAGRTGAVGNGETRPRCGRGAGSEIMGTEIAGPGRTSDSDAERAWCIGADCGGSGSARVGGPGFARDADSSERAIASELRARTSSADMVRESSRGELGDKLGTSGSGPCGGGVGGGML